MKPLFTFWFTDDERFTSKDPRQKTANQLRAFRADPYHYNLKRVGLHHYEVKSRYGNHAVMKVI